MTVDDGTKIALAPDPTAAAAVDGTKQTDGKPAEDLTKGKPVVDGKGSNPGWMAQLPGDLKTDSDLSKYATLGDYVKAVKEGKADGNEDETKQKTEPLKYEFEDVLTSENDPFGTVSKSMKGYLEGANVPEDVAKGLFAELEKAFKISTTELVEKGGKWCDDQLKKTWGDEYKDKRAAMSRAYVALVEPGSDMSRGLDRTGASINPYVAELLAKVGEGIREDGSMSSTKTRSSSTIGGGVPIDYSKPSA